MKEPTKLHVSDVIDFERDILPYRVIHIISGVGSGKNYFTNQIIRKKEKSRPYRVLYITSRKAMYL